MSINDGHRQRLRERFLAEGLDHFEEHNALELLLFYAMPRQDTRVLAKELLSRFGSLENVLTATAPELKKVAGVGDNIAIFLKLVNELGRYRAMRLAQTPRKYQTLEACSNLLVSMVSGLRNEEVYVMCLDGAGNLLCCKGLGEGCVNTAIVSVRKIVETALAFNATSVVMAHNHPCGVALPSREDVMTTNQVAKALAAVDVKLLDHIVVADGDYVSLLQSNYYRPADIY